MTEASSTCPDCGTTLPDDSPQQLCPSCLLKQAFVSRTLEADETTAPEPPPSPEEIADKFPQFEITECLGRGGMGVVYKALQKSLDRWVAIKVLAPERVDDEKFAERFAREAQTLAKLNHPNIVTVHDYGETDGLYYIVMEFVDGVNLRDLLQDGKIESSQALTIVPPICEALQYAHDKGIVHRDIKPENLLIDREGRIKIADFGIASLVGASNEQSGTPPYMAPEQGAHTHVDHRADIYALGVVLYEMLTGERPDTPLDVPSQRVQVDVRIDDIVLRALSKEPERRYRTANEFRSVVETVVDKKVVTDPPAIPATPSAKPVIQAGGNRTLSIIAVILAALITIASIPLALFLLLAPQKVDDPEPFHKVGFHVSHPDVISGNSTITRNVRQGRETDWSPSTGQELTLKNQDSLYFRCKVIAEPSGASQAFFETSKDQKTWQREVRTLSPSATDSFTLSNGITCKISNKLGPNPEPKSSTSRLTPGFVIGAALLLLLAAIIWAVKSGRARNPSEQHSAAKPKRSMFRRWWWIMLGFVLLGPVIGVFGGMLIGDLSPKMFEATSIIQVSPKDLSSPKPLEQFYGELLSAENLSQVAKRHELPKRWKIPESDAIRQLKESIQLNQLRGTDLIEIRVRTTSSSLTRLIANSLPELAAENSSSSRIIVHQKAQTPKTPVVRLRKWILIGIPLGLLLAPLLALAVMAILQRLIPERNPAAEAREPSDEQRAKNSFYGKVALWLFLAATLGTLAMMTLSSRHDMALIFGAVALFLSLIFGLMSKRRGVVIALISIVLLAAALSVISAVIFYFRMNSEQSAAIDAMDRARLSTEAIKLATQNQINTPKEGGQASSDLRFGQTIIREIRAPLESNFKCFLDLDTGKLIDVPSEIYPLVKHRFNAAVSKPVDVDRKINTWARDSGADLMISMTSPATHFALYGGHSRFLGSAFEDVSPTEVKEKIWPKPRAESEGKVPPPFISFSSPDSRNSESLAFRTREGAVGVLTVLETKQSPKRVKVGFKLIFDANGPLRTPSWEYQHIATDFLVAIQQLDVETAHALLLETAYEQLRPQNELTSEKRRQMLQDFKEMNKAYSADPTLMLSITEWHGNGGYRIGRVSPPKGGDGSSLSLVLALSPRGWRVNDVNDIRSDQSLSETLDEWLSNN